MVTPADLVVRPAVGDDLAALEHGLPTQGGGNATRLERSLSGASTLLVAFVGESCVGRGELLWSGPKEAEVRELHPDVLELNGLDVADDRRGHGIGTEIVEAAAALATERGFVAVGVGVGLDNDAAYRLYRRLGFDGDLEYVDRYTIVHEGVRRDFADRCRFLTRALAGRPDPAATR